jgi:hypothetical protein
MRGWLLLQAGFFLPSNTAGPQEATPFDDDDDRPETSSCPIWRPE